MDIPELGVSHTANTHTLRHMQGGSLTQTRASNYPLRGGKYSWLEGGIRTTAWVTGGVLPPPMRGKNLPSSHLIAVCDWHSTFLALAGVIEPADGKAKGGLSEVQTGGAADSSSMQQRTSSLPRIDSINQWPVISGERTTPLRDEVFVGSGVLISGNYKLIATSNPHDDARWSGPMYPKVPAFGNRTLSCSQRMPCLFDVVQDLRCVDLGLAAAGWHDAQLATCLSTGKNKIWRV
eukprot:SAG31_NODE_64_length_28590_cov_17.914464_7_plen_235_part_00